MLPIHSVLVIAPGGHSGLARSRWRAGRRRRWAVSPSRHDHGPGRHKNGMNPVRLSFVRIASPLPLPTTRQGTLSGWLGGGVGGRALRKNGMNPMRPDISTGVTALMRHYKRAARRSCRAAAECSKPSAKMTLTGAATDQISRIKGINHSAVGWSSKREGRPLSNSVRFHSSFSRNLSLRFSQYFWAEAGFRAIRPPSLHVLGLWRDPQLPYGSVWPLN